MFFLQHVSSLKYSNVPIEELSAEISNSDFKKIKIQMLALGILHPVKNRLQTETKWKLSEYGYNLMIKLIALKNNIMGPASIRKYKRFRAWQWSRLFYHIYDN